MKPLVNLPTKQQIEAEFCRRSYYEFLKRAWHILEPETEFEDNWHVKYLCDILQKEAERISRKEPKQRDLIINIPPRSLKSLIVTVFFNAWTWIENPHVSFITSSYSGELSQEHAVKTRRIIESDWYKERFNPNEDKKLNSFNMEDDQNAKSRFENDKSGSRRATSVGGTVTGGGADIVIVDDPHKVNEVHSETVRKGVIDWWSETMFSRLNDQRVGLRLVVMQRLHEEDLTGFLLDAGANYEHICIPATDEGEIKPLELKENYTDGLFSPNRFNRQVLEEAKKTLGTLNFTGQYLQSPAPAEGNIIKSEWFKSFGNVDLTEDVTVNYYTDSAYGKESSDNSATIAYSYVNNNIYVWHCWAWNATFPDFIKKYQDCVRGFNYSVSSRCIFEPKASGVSIVQELQSSTQLNVIEDKPPSESKMSRVSSISSVIEAGRVFLYNSGNGLEDLVKEATIFPNGKNDDRIDALTGAILHSISSINILFTTIPQ